MPTGSRLLPKEDLECIVNKEKRKMSEIDLSLFSYSQEAELELAKKIREAEENRRKEILQIGLGESVVKNLAAWQTVAELEL